ncbi:MAG TPA: hypothetical protein VH857_00065 [Actinomycetes bacterium]|nr:hypothetical protein [Actinomycetes bacterium]
MIAASAASVGRARELADELPRARVSRTVADAERHIERSSVDLAIVVADRLDAQSTAPENTTGSSRAGARAR